MNSVKKKFDSWAESGRDELMEKEHSKNVVKFLSSIKFNSPFSFLDVGCGNGWVVRHIAQNTLCKKATGIDTSRKMIQNARNKSQSEKEEYFIKNIETWKTKRKFDYVFSMESIYYVKSPESTVEKIFSLLYPGGKFFCGTDFYYENKATTKWKDMMEIPMHLKSKAEWKRILKDAGFNVKIKHILDTASTKKWKREQGTLFLIGTK